MGTNAVCEFCVYNACFVFVFIIVKPGREVIEFLSCSTQLSTKLTILINVDISTFISMINTTSKSESKKKTLFFSILVL